MTPELDKLRLELHTHLDVMAALKPWCDPHSKEAELFLVAFTWSRKHALETAGEYAQALANHEAARLREGEASR